MRKLLCLAFLLPLNAFANPFTVGFCLANLSDDICIGFNLDRARLDALQQQIDQESQDRIAVDDSLQQQIDDLQDSGGSEPLPEDIRSFFASVTDTSGSAALIQSPGEQAFFVITDIVLDAVGTSNQVKIRLRRPPDDLSEFWIRLDDFGFGNRHLRFESGIVVATQPGALSVEFVSGIGNVDVTVTGYYFTP